MKLVSAIIATVAIASGQLLAAQQKPLKPTAPGSQGDPTWQAVVLMTDGRRFITDGGLAVDAAVAKPAALPEREVPGKVMETYLAAAHKEECSFDDLTLASSGRTYTTPGGLPLNATYINYLRRIVPSGRARFRIAGDLEPVRLLVDDKVIAVLMPVKK
jgi:hypothetical protein